MANVSPCAHFLANPDQPPGVGPYAGLLHAFPGRSISAIISMLSELYPVFMFLLPPRPRPLP